MERERRKHKINCGCSDIQSKINMKDGIINKYWSLFAKVLKYLTEFYEKSS